MRGTFQIATIANTRVHVHGSFLLAFALAPAVAIALRGNALESAALVAALAALVAIHELGHVWVARQFGIRARSVTLYPFAALTDLAREPETPREEFMISLGGPVVSGLFGALLWLAIELVGSFESLALGGGGLAGRIFWMNQALALLSLLPVFPLDGGRALRAALRTRLGELRATAVVATSSQVAVTASLFALLLVDLRWLPAAALAGLLVWTEAQEELGRAELKEAMKHLPLAAGLEAFFRLDPWFDLFDWPLAHPWTRRRMGG